MAGFVLLKWIRNEYEAQIVVGILEAHGICVVSTPDGPRLYPNSTGSTNLYVPADQVAQARQLVESDFPIPAGSPDPRVQELPIAEGSSARETPAVGTGRIVPRRRGFGPKR
jgi:hypothetical protein